MYLVVLLIYKCIIYVFIIDLLAQFKSEKITNYLLYSQRVGMRFFPPTTETWCSISYAKLISYKFDGKQSFKI